MSIPRSLLFFSPPFFELSSFPQALVIRASEASRDGKPFSLRWPSFAACSPDVSALFFLDLRDSRISFLEMRSNPFPRCSGEYRPLLITPTVCNLFPGPQDKKTLPSGANHLDWLLSPDLSTLSCIFLSFFLGDGVVHCFEMETPCFILSTCFSTILPPQRLPTPL